MLQSNLDCHDAAHQALRNHPIFGQATGAETKELAESAHFFSMGKGETLYFQDSEAKTFYIIVHGWVKLYRETFDGEEAIADVLDDGAMIGENSLFNQGQYIEAAEVIAETQLLSLPLSRLKDLLHNSHGFALSYLDYVSREKWRADREVERRTLQTAPQRIGCFILRLCKGEPKGAVTLHLPYDKALIASRLGMKPETFSRALSKLRKEVDIHIAGATVTLKDYSQLAHYVCDSCSYHFPCPDIPDNSV